VINIKNLNEVNSKNRQLVYMAHAVATIRTAKTREHFFSQRYCQHKDSVTARHKNCPSSAFDDRPGRDLVSRVLKRPHALGLRRSCSDGKARVTRPDSYEDCIDIGVSPCYSHYAKRLARYDPV